MLLKTYEPIDKSYPCSEGVFNWPRFILRLISAVAAVSYQHMHLHIMQVCRYSGCASVNAVELHQKPCTEPLKPS